MHRYTRSHLSDQAVLLSLAARNEQELSATADLLADLAEVDARKLYLGAGYSSMFRYCVEMLHRSEVAAYKRIRAARAARRFPVIFEAIARGRLHLSAVVILAPHLTEDTAADLLAAASLKTTKQVEQLLAERFPQPDVPTRVLLVPVSHDTEGLELTLRSVEVPAPGAPEPDDLTSRSVMDPSKQGTVAAPEPAWAPSVPLPAERAVLKPLAPQRFALQVTIDQKARDALRHAQELLSHELPSGDVSQIIGMALEALIPQLEKRKFAATDRPRPGRPGSSAAPRDIPARVQREVWERDGGECTFVSHDGHRCAERKFVEFDHVHEVARGGEASVANLRLRCRAHNQYTAECTFGAEFMRHKKIAARERAAVRSGGASRTQPKGAPPNSSSVPHS